MADMQLYAEAYNRGILPDEIKPLFKEAVKRNLAPGASPPKQEEGVARGIGVTGRGVLEGVSGTEVLPKIRTGV